MQTFIMRFIIAFIYITCFMSFCSFLGFLIFGLVQYYIAFICFASFMSCSFLGFLIFDYKNRKKSNYEN